MAELNHPNINYTNKPSFYTNNIVQLVKMIVNVSRNILYYYNL